MRKCFKYTDYFRPFTLKVKEDITQDVLTYLETAKESTKNFFKSKGSDVDRMLLASYRGYLTEQFVLDYLQRKYPDSMWHYTDFEDHSCFYLDDSLIYNKPDLINDKGTTVEVKRTHVYSNYIYFSPYYSGDIWKTFFHSTAYVAAVDDITNDIYFFSKEYFETHIDIVPNKYNPTQLSYRLDLSDLYRELT